MHIIDKKMDKFCLKNAPSYKKNQGYSLIEVMFSFTMGILIIGLVLGLLWSNQRSKNITESYALIVNNANQAMSILTTSIRSAGYDPANSTVAFSFYSGGCGSASSCTFDGTTVLGDQIAVRYSPTNGFDCARNPIADGEITTDIFYIAEDTNNNNINSLFCRGYNTTSNSFRGLAMPLVAGIDRLDIIYGLSNNGLHIDQYLPANSITRWDLINSVRISILVRSPENIQIFDENTRSYNLSRAGTVSYTDRIVRQLFSTTVSLENVK